MRWLIGYLFIGAALAVLCDRRHDNRTLAVRLVSSLLCLTLWPLWAPVALLPEGGSSPTTQTIWRERIARTLYEARSAARGTPLEALVPESLVERVLEAATTIEQRYVELSVLLNRPDLARANASGRREQSVERLRQLWQRDQQLLSQLSEMAEALRMQLLVARYSGGSADAARDIAAELGGQIESLDEWFSLDPTAPSRAADPLCSASY